MTYNVLIGTLNPTHSLARWRVGVAKIWSCLFTCCHWQGTFCMCRQVLCYV